MLESVFPVIFVYEWPLRRSRTHNVVDLLTLETRSWGHRIINRLTLMIEYRRLQVTLNITQPHNEEQ